jgi:site-specific DNA recombinase
VVLRELQGLLCDESRLMGLMGTVGAEDAKARFRTASALAHSLGLAAADRIEVLTRLVARIMVRETSIEIAVRTAAIWSSVEVLPDDEEITSIEVPVQLRRCGMAVRLIVRTKEAVGIRGPDAKLVAALAKGQRWFASLSSGRSAGVLAIAQEHCVTSSYVSRMVYLSFLAPDIVQRIVRGEQPVGLDTKRLLNLVPLPLDWGEQRRVLGFDG